mgnify:CR=1 FL=1
MVLCVRVSAMELMIILYSGSGISSINYKSYLCVCVVFFWVFVVPLFHDQKMFENRGEKLKYTQFFEYVDKPFIE